MLEKDVLSRVLVCPETKCSLQLISQYLVDEVNGKIIKGEAISRNGLEIKTEIQGGLFCKKNSSLYLIRDGIPLMLIGESIHFNNDAILAEDENINLSRELRVNTGCAHRPLPGYINVDIDRNSKADVICDLRFLPFGDEAISEILCVHVLEHLNEDRWRERIEISEAVLEFNRVLTNDGTVNIEVPSPQGSDAIRFDHLTVYSYKRLRMIFGFYFEEMECSGVATWVEARFLERVFSKLSKWEPFWGNAYRFSLSKPKRVKEPVLY